MPDDRTVPSGANAPHDKIGPSGARIPADPTTLSDAASLLDEVIPPNLAFQFQGTSPRPVDRNLIASEILPSSS